MSFQDIVSEAVQDTDRTVPQGTSGIPDPVDATRRGALRGIDAICPGLPRKAGEAIEIAGCKITCVEEPSARTIPNTGSIVNFWQGEKTKAAYGKYKCESEYLGDFEFDSAYFTVGYKPVTGDDGITKQVPVLRYQDNGLENKGQDFDWKMFNLNIGTTSVAGSPIEIPSGVKRLDYTFEDCGTLENLPRFPDSVISADCAFVGCDNIREQISYFAEYMDDIGVERASSIIDRKRFDLCIDALGDEDMRREMDEFWKMTESEPDAPASAPQNSPIEKSISEDTTYPGLPTKKGETVEIAGCKIMCIEDASPRTIPGTQSIANLWQGEKTSRKYGRYVCESDELGTFLFDSAYFTVGYKDVEYSDGQMAQKPVLKYVPGLEDYGQTLDWKFMNSTIASQTTGARIIEVPNGVKSIDYTFEDCNTLPPVHVPDSVTSARGAFIGCDSKVRIDAPAAVMTEGFDAASAYPSVSDEPARRHSDMSLHDMFNETTGLKGSKSWNASEPMTTSDLVREMPAVEETQQADADGLGI